MKHRFLFLALLATSLLTVSCGGDDDTSNDSSVNVNANTQGSTTRLEFPHLQGSSNYEVLVHWDASVNPSQLNYSVEYDKQKQSQLWSCYQLHKGNTYNGSGVKRYNPTDGSPQYPADPLYQTTDLIRGSGYDHGHIIPSADRLNTQNANIQTFYLTNMQPQVNPFNAGIWADGEIMLRNLAKNASRVDTVYVCKGGTIGHGGTLENQILEVRSNGLIVPRYFFVALLSVKNGVYHSIGILYDQKSNGYSNGEPTYPAPKTMSIDDLEALLGFDFFCNLPDKREKVIENTFEPALWGY